MKRCLRFCLCATLLILGAAYASAQRILHVSQTNPSPTPPYATRDTAAHTIQEAVDAASDGDAVLVAEGEYLLTNQITITKGILLRSDAGSSQTILNGQDSVRCLWISNSVAVVDGFMMTRGASDESGGGGVYLVGATVQNCIIVRCNSFRASVAGGAVVIGGTLSNSIVTGTGRGLDARSAVDCTSGGLITDCQITGNGGSNGRLYTGAVYLTDSEFRNSVISNNFADASGGVYALSSTIVGCTMANNWAIGGQGGGAYLDRCEVDRCIIVGNRNSGFIYPPGRGGGIFTTDSVIRNSLIAGNRAANSEDSPGLGGGIYLRGGSLLNCTITGNQAADAGGIYVESGNARNSIIYFNSASTNPNCYNGGGSFTQSCTTPDPSGVGNIVGDPQFVDGTRGNYRLAPTSPCIDAGINEAWMADATDLDGNTRIFSGTVDLGAWERQTMNTAPVTRIQVKNSAIFFDQPTVITLVASSGAVILDGSQTSNAENDPLTYTWSVGDPPEIFATGARVIAPVPPGSYVFQLQVSDGELTGTASASVAVLTPCDAIAFLRLRIEESSHPNGLKRPLVNRLKESCNSFDKGKVSKGIENLKVFQVRVAEMLGDIGPAFAELLIHEAQTLIDAIPTEYPTATNKKHRS